MLAMMRLAILLLVSMLLKAQAQKIHCDNGDCPTNMYYRRSLESRECKPCSQRKEDCHTKEQPKECGRYCATVKCHDPPTVINSHMKGIESSYSVASVIHYNCRDGFEMQGKEHRIWECLANGTWSRNTAPMCLEVRKPEIKCPEPRHILHGLHNANAKKDSQPGDTIGFKCDNDYELIGDKVITCLVDGRWDSDPPTCHRGGCSCAIPILLVVLAVFGSIVCWSFVLKDT